MGDRRKVVVGLVLILLCTLLLRVPSFFEPLWYRDESISLTLAQAVRRGLLLYRDIHDNKPPLFYLLLALSPTLRWARLLTTAFVLSTQLAVFLLVKKLFSSRRYAFLACALFGVLSSIPPLEGNIANGEIWLILPVTLAMYLGLTGKASKEFVAGALFGMATLLKVPAVFDFLAFLTFSYFFVGEKRGFFRVALGFSLPWLTFLLFFTAHGALRDFLSSVFWYNLRYVEVGRELFPAWVKLLLFSSFFLLVFSLWWWREHFSTPFGLLGLWFLFSLSGSLLSGRPYTHYLIQTFPVLSILGVHSLQKSSTLERGLSAAFFLSLFTLYELLPFYRYPLFSYYQNFWKLLSHSETAVAYRNFFDPWVTREYEIANYVRSHTGPGSHILVYGDEPGIYALSMRRPAIKYVANYHIDAAAAWVAVSKQLLRSPPLLVIQVTTDDKLPLEFWERYSVRATVEGVPILGLKETAL